MRQVRFVLGPLLVVCSLSASCKEKEKPAPQAAREQRRGGAIPQPMAASAKPVSVPANSGPATPFPPPADAKTSPAGVIHIVTRPGTGQQKPVKTDTVKLAYAAWKADGAPYDSRTKDKPLHVEVRHLTPGLAETVMSMVPGEQRRAWLRWDLVRSLGVPTDIKLLDPPYGDLTIDIELVSIGGAAPDVTANRPSDKPPQSSAKGQK